MEKSHPRRSRWTHDPVPVVPPPTTTKAIIKGIFTRGEVVAAGTPVRCPTRLVYWKDVEPTQGTYVRTPIDSVLNDAQNKGLDGVRLRFMMGIHAPDWAKNIGAGPVTYTDAQDGVSNTIGALYDAAYQAAGEAVTSWIATTYDADPRLRLFFATLGMTVYAEPFIRSFGVAANRTSFVTIGYSQTADKALMRKQLDICAPFTQTPIGLAYNPLSQMTDSGSANAGQNATECIAVMDYHLGAFGTRTVLHQNSWRIAYKTNPPASYAPMYTALRDRVASPGETQYQVANSNQITNGTTLTVAEAADQSMAAAIEDTATGGLQASGVELINGWGSIHTTGELQTWDADLKANP